MLKSRIGEWEIFEGWDYLIINEYSNGRAIYNPLTNKYVFLDNKGIEEKVVANNFYKKLQLKNELQADINYTKACHIEAKIKKDLTEKENEIMKKKKLNTTKPTGKWVATIYTANNYQSLGEEEVVLFRCYEETRAFAVVEIKYAIETYFNVNDSFRVEIIQKSS